jgi:hypothetical protein
MALGYAVEAFCRLVRQQSSVAQVVNKYAASIPNYTILCTLLHAC